MALSSSIQPSSRPDRANGDSIPVCSVPVAELLSRLPADYRSQKTREEDFPSYSIDLPCRELFHGNTPRLPVGRLQQLLPGLMILPAGVDPDQRIALPAGWLALHFRLIGRKNQSEPLEKIMEVVLPPEKAEEEPGLQHGSGSPAVPAREEMIQESVSVPAVTVSPSPSLTLERLWKLDPQDQLLDPFPLQSLFMTEEKLTLERVLALAGELPGLRACVLAHGDLVVCASNIPSGIDLQTLSGQAVTMLSQIRESSSQMGLGAVPAITLHGEQGILSFLHQGEICLLVLHADRGFVPGVRERLQEMLGHLSLARPLPGGNSVQPSLPI